MDDKSRIKELEEWIGDCLIALSDDDVVRVLRKLERTGCIHFESMVNDGEELLHGR